MKTICVVGAGAVGGYFGGRLAASNAPVSFFARGDTAAAIRKNGLRIGSVAGDAQVRPPVVERSASNAPVDFILWAVKTYHNPDAIEAVRPLVGGHTSILSLQNGVEAVDELAAAFGLEKIVGGFASLAGESIEPGVIRHTGLGRITIGELDGRESKRVRDLAGLLKTANIPHQISKAIRRDLWAKLVWNAAFNPLSVILRATVDELLADLAALSILKRSMDEVLRVAAAEGFDLPASLLETYLQPKDPPVNFRTSMLQDFLRKRPMEIDAISGAVVRAGRKRNIAVPVSELFFDLLRVLESRVAKESAR